MLIELPAPPTLGTRRSCSAVGWWVGRAAPWGRDLRVCAGLDNRTREQCAQALPVMVLNSTRKLIRVGSARARSLHMDMAGRMLRRARPAAPLAAVSAARPPRTAAVEPQKKS